MAGNQPFFLYNNMNKKIKIIVTGGTFDKEYNEINGEYFNWDNVRKNKKIGEFEEID